MPILSPITIGTLSYSSVKRHIVYPKVLGNFFPDHSAVIFTGVLYRIAQAHHTGHFYQAVAKQVN